MEPINIDVKYENPSLLEDTELLAASCVNEPRSTKSQKSTKSLLKKRKQRESDKSRSEGMITVQEVRQTPKR